MLGFSIVFFFFQAEDGIRDIGVTGVQTCALPISADREAQRAPLQLRRARHEGRRHAPPLRPAPRRRRARDRRPRAPRGIGRASCRERGEISGGAVLLKKKKVNIINYSKLEYDMST